MSQGDSPGLEVGQWSGGGLPGFSAPLCPAALIPSLPRALCPHLGLQPSKLRVSWVWTFQPWIFKEPRGWPVPERVVPKAMDFSKHFAGFVLPGC